RRTADDAVRANSLLHAASADRSVGWVESSRPTKGPVEPPSSLTNLPKSLSGPPESLTDLSKELSRLPTGPAMLDGSTRSFGQARQVRTGSTASLAGPSGSTSALDNAP